jgi:hypothetical protein
MVEKPGTINQGYCNCDLRRILVSANFLRPRKITTNAKKTAFIIKRNYLETLAGNSEIPIVNDEIEELFEIKGLSEHLLQLMHMN